MTDLKRLTVSESVAQKGIEICTDKRCMKLREVIEQAQPLIEQHHRNLRKRKTSDGAGHTGFEAARMLRRIVALSVEIGIHVDTTVLMNALNCGVKMAAVEGALESCILQSRLDKFNKP